MTKLTRQKTRLANRGVISAWDRLITWVTGNSCCWQGKTVVVCGGSSGLGLSIADELIRQQVSQLILIARNPEQLAVATERLRCLAAAFGEASLNNGSGLPAPQITPIAADMADLASLAPAIHQISQRTSRIDLVIQAVGASDRGSIASLTRQRLIELVDANLVTSLHAVQQFAPLLQSAAGVLVLVGSLSSFFAPRYLGGYSVAKHGLVALAQQARLELADKGVHVTLCCPGPIARTDAGNRYAGVSGGQELPSEAQLPGGGAKVRGLVAEQLSRDLLRAAWRRELLIIRPRKAWWLRLVSLLSARLGERILRSKSA